MKLHRDIQDEYPLLPATESISTAIYAGNTLPDLAKLMRATSSGLYLSGTPQFRYQLFSHQRNEDDSGCRAECAESYPASNCSMESFLHYNRDYMYLSVAEDNVCQSCLCSSSL